MDPDCFNKAIIAQSRSWVNKAIELDMPEEMVWRFIHALRILEERNYNGKHKSSTK